MIFPCGKVGTTFGLWSSTAASAEADMIDSRRMNEWNEGNEIWNGKGNLGKEKTAHLRVRCVSYLYRRWFTSKLLMPSSPHHCLLVVGFEVAKPLSFLHPRTSEDGCTPQPSNWKQSCNICQPADLPTRSLCSHYIFPSTHSVSSTLTGRGTPCVSVQSPHRTTRG